MPPAPPFPTTTEKEPEARELDVVNTAPPAPPPPAQFVNPPPPPPPTTSELAVRALRTVKVPEDVNVCVL